MSMKKLTVLLLSIITIVMSVSAAYAEFPDCLISGEVYNCEEYVTLRSWPSREAPALERLYLGEGLLIRSRKVYKDGEWDFVMVESLQGQVGYAWLNCVRMARDDWYKIQQEDTYGIGYGTVTAKDAFYHSNLRAGPGTQYDAIGYLFGGEVAPYQGKSQKDKNGRVWYCCEVDGMTCWVSSKVTTLRKP